MLTIEEIKTLSRSYMIYIQDELNQVYSYRDNTATLFFVVNGIDILEATKSNLTGGQSITWYGYNIDDSIINIEVTTTNADTGDRTFEVIDIEVILNSIKAKKTKK